MDYLHVQADKPWYNYYIWTDAFTLQVSRISFNKGSIVAGPLLQFNPTTLAPASSRRRHASGNGTSSKVTSGTNAVSVMTAGKPIIYR